MGDDEISVTSNRTINKFVIVGICGNKLPIKIDVDSLSLGQFQKRSAYITS